MRTRLWNHCQEEHRSWPAKGRYTRHLAEPRRRKRMHSYAADVRAVGSIHDQTQSPWLGLVDLDTARSAVPAGLGQIVRPQSAPIRVIPNCQLRLWTFDQIHARANTLAIMKA